MQRFARFVPVDHSLFWVQALVLSVLQAISVWLEADPERNKPVRRVHFHMATRRPVLIVLRACFRTAVVHQSVFRAQEGTSVLLAVQILKLANQETFQEIGPQRAFNAIEAASLLQTKNRHVQIVHRVHRVQLGLLCLKFACQELLRQSALISVSVA